ncbi:MAG: response regulator transcription factor [Nanoarchaeota archaeon]
MKRILYVEDNPDTASAVKIILSGQGYSVETAANGEEGIAKALGSQFDLILLDVMLPDMSGWDIYAKIKTKVNAKYAFLSAIPVSTERMAQLLREGVSDYITKPFAKADLIERVKKILV